jgi:hypothetical protein
MTNTDERMEVLKAWFTRGYEDADKKRGATIWVTDDEGAVAAYLHGYEAGQQIAALFERQEAKQ